MTSFMTFVPTEEELMVRGELDYPTNAWNVYFCQYSKLVYRVNQTNRARRMGNCQHPPIKRISKR